MTDIYDKMANDVRSAGVWQDAKGTHFDTDTVALVLRKQFGPLQDKVGDFISDMGVCEEVEWDDDGPNVCEAGECNYCDMIRAFQAYIGYPVKEDLAGAVLTMFRGCDTMAQLQQALLVALTDTGNTASDVNEVYHQVLDEKGWR